MSSQALLRRRLKMLGRQAEQGEDGEPVHEDPYWPLGVMGDPTAARALFFITKPFLARLIGPLVKDASCLFLIRYGIPSRATLRTLHWFVNSLNLPIGFVGDLDVYDLMTFMAIDESFRKLRPRGDSRCLYAGISDPWLELARSFIKPSITLEKILVRQKDLDQERWRIMKRLYPHLESIIGKESASLLDRGVELDVVALCQRTFYRRGYIERLVDLVLSQVRPSRAGRRR